jgi:curli biogenesis system outer membrane secretion channel CsgG
VIEALQKRGDFTVVEREHLILALEELGLGTTSVVDEATQLELGRLVGARLMVFGGYQVIEDKMSLDLRLVEVETGRVLKATRKITSASDLAGWLRAAEEATAGLF